MSVDRRRFLTLSALAAGLGGGALASGPARAQSVESLLERVPAPEPPAEAFRPVADVAPVVGRRPGFAVSFGDVIGRSVGELDRLFAAGRAAGAGGIRIDVPWDFVERDRGVYDWVATDRVLAAIDRAGLTPLGLLDYSPPWASVGWTRHAAPAPWAVADWGAFVRAAAQRYGSTVPTWEIWNEPNLGEYWGPAASASAYTPFLVAAYRQIKAVRPGAASTVLVGGLAPAQVGWPNAGAPEFLEDVYRSGGAGAFDGVAMHPYTYPSDPGDPTRPWALDDGWGRTQALRQVMQAHGDGDKSIWLTEFGFPTGADPRAVSEARQGELVTRAMRTMLAEPWVAGCYLYTLQDTVAPDSAGAALRFGVLRRDGSAKPAHSAMATASA